MAKLKLFFGVLASISPIFSQEVCIGVEKTLPHFNQKQIEQITLLGINTVFNHPFSHLKKNKTSRTKHFYSSEDLFETWILIAIPFVERKIKPIELLE